jgi:Predicted Fe-S-cluster oxidoreductase
VQTVLFCVYKLFFLQSHFNEPRKKESEKSNLNKLEKSSFVPLNLSRKEPFVRIMKKAEAALEYFNDEEQALAEYRKEQFIEVISDVGFECDFCGKCCTQKFNSHVYLLSEDVKRVSAENPNSVRPSPYFDFCDQNGCFYVSGYSLKTKDDEDGSCLFLENKRCLIYENRPLICRIYPYMIHREEGSDGTYDWREISGLNEHGLYGAEIEKPIAEEIYEDVRKYEQGYISQEKAFLKAVSDEFKKNNLKHIPKIYDKRIRDFEKGEEVTVFVYFDGVFQKHVTRKN